MKKKKQNPFIIVLKIIMLILTAVYPVMMVMLSGAGIIYNRESYGSELEKWGILLMISGGVIAAGAVMCLIRKNLTSLLAIIFSGSGLGLCLSMLYKITAHADKAGWSDKRTMLPISDMYEHRILPTIAPAALIIIISVIYLLSYDAAEERRKRRQNKKEKENASAPSILD